MNIKNFKFLIKKLINLNFSKYYEQNHLSKIFKTNDFRNYQFDPNYITKHYNKNNYKIQILDLITLDFIVKYSKRMTVLEFGCGTSSLFIANALAHNKKMYLKFVKKNIRKANLFELYSVDSSKKYIKKTKELIKSKRLQNDCYLTFSESKLTLYNHEITSEFNNLPNISPDFIFIDGPHVRDVKGKINNIDFNTHDRTLTGCDILKIENFLLPGTIILLDGLTNYAYFLKNNFKRNWTHIRVESLDLNFFLLIDRPLGYLNRRQLKFYNS